MEFELTAITEGTVVSTIRRLGREQLTGLLVALKSFRPLLEIVQPLEEKEAENLRGYMRSLLPHQRATHMPIERFYAFASAIESIAFRRGDESGEEARQTIYRIIESTTRGPDSGGTSAVVPVDRDPKPDPKSAAAKPKPRSGPDESSLELSQD